MFLLMRSSTVCFCQMAAVFSLLERLSMTPTVCQDGHDSFSTTETWEKPKVTTSFWETSPRLLRMSKLGNSGFFIWCSWIGSTRCCLPQFRPWTTAHWQNEKLLSVGFHSVLERALLSAQLNAAKLKMLCCFIAYSAVIYSGPGGQCCIFKDWYNECWAWFPEDICVWVCSGW